MLRLIINSHNILGFVMGCLKIISIRMNDYWYLSNLKRKPVHGERYINKGLN